MRPRHAPRVGALDVVFRLGDYAMLMGCVVMTVIVLAGLRHADAPGLKLMRSWSSYGQNRPFDRMLSLREAIRFAPLPAWEGPAPADPASAKVRPQGPATATFAQELEMRPSQLIDRWNPLIAEASKRVGLSADWIRAVMRVETGGRTMQKGNKPITSHAGAVGIMQMMPKTYQAMRAQYGLGANPSNPHDNIIAGAAYLRTLYHRYGFPNMFAAYNGGPGTLENHLQNGAPLPNETVNYIASVTRNLGERANTIAEAQPRRRHRFSAMLSG